MFNPDDYTEDELAQYKKQIEEEFFTSVEKGENLYVYLYIPYNFLSENVKSQLDVFLIEEAYKNLFVNKKEDWVVYDDGYRISRINEKDKKKTLLESMLEHYASKEDYSKCTLIKHEMEKI